MNQVNKDALEAVVDEDGIYTVLTELVRIMKKKARTGLPAQRPLARRIAASIERARDMS